MVSTPEYDANQLAHRGLRNVYDTVSELIKGSKAPKAFLSNLSAELVSVAEWLKEARGLEEPKNVDRVLKLLAILEKLGRYPRSFQVSVETDDLSQYKILQDWEEARHDFRKAMCDLAAYKNLRRQNKFLSSLARIHKSKQPSRVIEFLKVKPDGKELKVQQRWDCQGVLLSYVLAQSFWQLYGSDWMRNPWTKSDVHFMFEERAAKLAGIYVNEPFLSTQFNGRTMPKNPAMAHRFPKILALGTMLLEIGLGVGIETLRLPSDVQIDGRPHANTDLIVGTRVLAEKRAENEFFPPFADVVERCLDIHSFREYEDDDEGLRHAIEERIVNVLHSCYNDCWLKDPDFDDINPVILNPPTSSRTLMSLGRASDDRHGARLIVSSSQANWDSPQGYPNIPHLSASSLPSSLAYGPIGTLSSNHWFEEFDIFDRVIRSPISQNSSSQPSRIVILDTGVRSELSSLTTSYKDFISVNGFNYQDNTNHGTCAVALIKRIYTSADIYVGRVFEGQNASDNTASLMAQAIDHARTIWKADIIVMPSGFDAANTDLELAINDARNAKVLIFAAASNFGNIRDIAFPARLYTSLKLFCMFSTTAGIRANCDFNPSPSPHAKHNFAVLGEDVELPIPALSNEPFKLSGTSFSAMIAAAIAGQILEFVRHEHASGLISCADKIRTVEGMSAVFSAMAQDKDNGYHCIAPWKILSQRLRHETVDKVEAREDLRITIIRALESC
ncbi:extracellular alkaline serine protease [Colletotrichum tamarilloi]|uniref:Extracellular alkaline serine protease n=1 Tax=Colletotrichum tamarilloi TaxID=1209934 RepID=A0ABQ9RUV6_9PEZI|nr:extracellular alkaline serine protease [Colletotrichum tamarilloi]KAK1513160.1 extracellular alkaline serine protease [Colletotrichum tamarilloi]